MEWQFSNARDRLSELLDDALTKGPQSIRRNADVVVVLSLGEFESLRGTRPSFKQMLLRGPGMDALDLHRDRSDMRSVDFS